MTGRRIAVFGMLLCLVTPALSPVVAQDDPKGTRKGGTQGSRLLMLGKQLCAAQRTVREDQDKVTVAQRQLTYVQSRPVSPTQQKQLARAQTRLEHCRALVNNAQARVNAIVGDLQNTGGSGWRLHVSPCGG